MSVLSKAKIQVVADAGVAIYPAIREAIVMALTENRDVELIFNNTKIHIQPLEVIGTYAAIYDKLREVSHS